jgi:hypothetical protein
MLPHALFVYSKFVHLSRFPTSRHPALVCMYNLCSRDSSEKSRCSGPICHKPGGLTSSLRLPGMGSALQAVDQRKVLAERDGLQQDASDHVMHLQVFLSPSHTHRPGCPTCTTNSVSQTKLDRNVCFKCGGPRAGRKTGMVAGMRVCQRKKDQRTAPANWWASSQRTTTMIAWRVSQRARMSPSWKRPNAYTVD